VTQKDFRLNFCINNGSKSMPSMVPVYSPDYLDELLDEVSAAVCTYRVRLLSCIPVRQRVRLGCLWCRARPPDVCCPCTDH
jgi:hypothetical protein